MVLSYSALAESLLPPPKPDIAPLIAETYPNDTDGNRIDDELANKAQKALAASNAGGTMEEKTEAQAALGKMVDVELVFKQPIIQKHIDQFIALGGEITYLYKAVSYGWNGRIPLGKVSEVPATMREGLLLIEEPKPATVALFEATQAGRVRPIWAAGFAENSFGFQGDTNITIAIIDTGVDETHPDLAGRRVYSRNFTDDNSTRSGFVGFHGTMVAGVALGTGAASGSGTSTLFFTHAGGLSGLSGGQFVAAPMQLPVEAVDFTMSAIWDGGRTTTLALASYDRWGVPVPPPDVINIVSISGEPPLNLTCSVTGEVTRVFTPRLNANGGATNFAVSCQVSNYPGLRDGFNKLRGVAPGCHWADARVIRANNTAESSWIGAALDDLVSQRITLNIKILNLSVAMGMAQTLRQKVNSAVNAGIVVAAIAGNGGWNATDADRLIYDPGRAAFALTLAASVDDNQLTGYSSYGFIPAYTNGPYAEDYKPDLMAPGGGRGTYVMAPDDNANDYPFPDRQPNDYCSASGTSFAAPFAAGCAALVIEAMERLGIQWDFGSSRHPLFVKMLLCATATESNLPRASTNFNPTLQRAANGPIGYPACKDQYEGYGMINPDAAVEAVCLAATNGVTYAASLGSAPSDRRVWARKVELEGGKIFLANLTVPAAGDFDLYLYSATPNVYGNPVIFAASTQAGTNISEMLNYKAITDISALLVVKRVWGSGEFSLVADVAPPPLLASPSLDGKLLIFSIQTLTRRAYYVDYKDDLTAPSWTQLGFLQGDGTLMKMTNSILGAPQRFYRLRVQ